MYFPPWIQSFTDFLKLDKHIQVITHQCLNHLHSCYVFIFCWALKTPQPTLLIPFFFLHGSYGFRVVIVPTAILPLISIIYIYISNLKSIGFFLKITTTSLCLYTCKNDENRIRNKGVMTFWNFTFFQETFLDQALWIFKWASRWCHALTIFNGFEVLLINMKITLLSTDNYRLCNYHHLLKFKTTLNLQVCIPV